VLCELLEVSASGYYRWRQGRLSTRGPEDLILQEQIALVHRESRGTYGAPRVVQRAAGTRRAHQPPALWPADAAQGIRGKKRHSRRPQTTQSGHGRPVPANLMATCPRPTGPDQVWVTDITYVPTLEGWLYVAVILDGWSRRIVGWACAATLHANLVVAALRSALAARRPAPALVHHSDRGSQYVDEQ
jgi:transposase InsO family protein